jgi:predicted ATPase
MLNELSLRNFKSARELSVRLAPLTVLTGLNGSGKSSVLQAIALLKQSFDRFPDHTQLTLRGELVSLGRSEDVHSEGAKSDEIEIGLGSDDGLLNLVAEVIARADTLPVKRIAAKGKSIVSAFEGFQFIQADRLTPASQYLLAGTPVQKSGWLGSKGEFTVDFLQRKGDVKISKVRLCPSSDEYVSAALLKQVAPTDSLADQTAGWLQQLSPGVIPRAVSVELADATSLRFQYTGTAVDTTSRDHRASNVGFGLTYSLPIIVACLAAPSGSLLLLENPEAHLHPRGQAALGRLMAQCAADGVQILVETHSDHILNGIRLAAKRQIVAPSSVAFHFFVRDVETGESSVVSPRLLENGRLDDWPLGFFDQWGKALDELLD